MSENVQDIKQNHQIHHGSHEKLENEIDDRKINFSRDENTERLLPGRLAMVTTICNSNDPTQIRT